MKPAVIVNVVKNIKSEGVVIDLLTAALLCKKAYNGFKVENHSFAVADLPDATIIAIAGTANLENVLEDASVWPRKSPSGAFAHAGVMDAFTELEKAVEGHVPKDRRLVFAGHSLGGGIAQIFAEKYSTEVITFGSLKTYFRFYPAPKLYHSRVVCDDDPVPLVPGIMYSHRNEAIELKDKDNEILDVKDHSIDVYINRLKRRIS